MVQPFPPADPWLFQNPSCYLSTNELDHILRSPTTSNDPVGSDQDLAERMNRDFAPQFADETLDLKKAKWHKKVAVLLFSWYKESPDVLDTTEEMRLLGDVFRNKYNYSVHEKWLSTKPEAGLPEHQLAAHFANFIQQEDAKDALIIVYYGGHGYYQHTKERLRIMGGNAAEEHQTKRNEIILSESIKCFHRAQADKLLILDCCFAGHLTEDAPHNGISDDIFEFIGSCGKYELARGPGSGSFTTALTRSLEVLADESKEGFTVTTLLKRITRYEQFSKQQTPVSSEVGRKMCLRRLKIVPTPDLKYAECEVGNESDPDDQIRFYVNLRFHFSSPPTSDHISLLARACKHLVQDSQMPIQHVVWNGISHTNDQVEWARVIGHAWRSRVMQRRLARGYSSPALPTPQSLDVEQARAKEEIRRMDWKLNLLYDIVTSRYRQAIIRPILAAFILVVIIIGGRNYGEWFLDKANFLGR